MPIPTQTTNSGPWQGSTLTLDELQEMLKGLPKLPRDPLALPFPLVFDPPEKDFEAMTSWRSRWSASIIRPEAAAIIRLDHHARQVRFPRSKKRRIRAKWTARAENWA